MATQYTESVFCEAKPVIADGVIRGVKILGEHSVNGRRYGKAVREKARAKYEGARVNVDHPQKGASPERSFRDWVGVIENVQVRADGSYGDLRLRQEHSDYKSIVEAAEKFWKDFGLSHVADCESKRIGDTDEITDIVEVFSVDIVTDPATTKGLTESRDRRMKKTVKQLAESLPADNTVRKLLMEMDSGGYDIGSLAVDEPAGVADPSINSELVAALTKTNEMLLMVLAKGKAQATPAPTPNPEPDPMANEQKPEGEEEKKPFPPTAEAKQLADKIAILEAKNLLLESGIEASDVRVKALARAEESDRKALLESWPAKAANTRESRGERPDRSPPANDSHGKQTDPEAIFEARQKKLDKIREQRQLAVR